MPPRQRTTRSPVSQPHLGLVCITASEEIRYRTITRTRYLSLDPQARRAALSTVYAKNLAILDRAIAFCAAQDIRLYRVTSGLFPFSDEPLGREVLLTLRDALAAVGRRIAAQGLRVLSHPDQYVVLSSDSPQVVANSITILQRHALAFDLLGLPQTPWAAINIHGGKGGRHDALVRSIDALPPNVRNRLTLENDERAYSAAQIHAACRAAGVPMVFDAHHHLVREKLPGYDDPSVREWTLAARATWSPESWQIVHISNGRSGLHDPRHSDTIRTFPAAFRDVQWVEVEAKSKEIAITALRNTLP